MTILKIDARGGEILTPTIKMQSRLMCCGGNNWHTGYTDYRGTSIGRNGDSVPDSCCISPNEGCGRGVLKQSAQVIQDSLVEPELLTNLEGSLPIGIESFNLNELINLMNECMDE